MYIILAQTHYIQINTLLTLDFDLDTMTVEEGILSVPWINIKLTQRIQKNVREKSKECHNHKPQPLPDTKRKWKQTKPNKCKSNKRTKSTKNSSLFPKRGNRYAKRTEKHKNKITQGKTYKKSHRRIYHKATKSKTNTGTTVSRINHRGF